MNRSILLLPAPLSRFCQGSLSQQWRTKRREMQVSPTTTLKDILGLLWLFLFFPRVPFLCPSLVTLPLKHMRSDSHLLLAVICIFQTQNFGFLTLSLPETNKILKLCFHLNSKENPRSENFWHILQRNFLFAIPWYQLQ